MIYCVSDIHGEYELFKRLVERIGFSADDHMYICGDIIDKGQSSIKLARYIVSFPNIHCIIGNHELAFLNYYHSILRTSPEDFDEVLKKLREYFPEDGHLLDWDLVDWLDALPAYIEEEDFICVHAGVPISSDLQILPLAEASVEELVYDRRFKDPKVIHESPKCVLFGHTQTNCVCGENKILGYRRAGRAAPESIVDFYKIHLDTGAWSDGVLGCFCMDTLKTVYVKK